MNKNTPTVLIAKYYDGHISLLSSGINELRFAPKSQNEIFAQSMREDAETKNGITDAYYVCKMIDQNALIFECLDTQKQFQFRNINGIYCPIN
jgi:hypothetical protein